MTNNIKVHVVYKDKAMDTVQEKDYSLDDYTECLKFSLLKTISEIEDAFYTMQHGKLKQQWDDKSLCSFEKIRHKLLDCANSVQRIPQNLHFQEDRIHGILMDIDRRIVQDGDDS